MNFKEPVETLLKSHWVLLQGVVALPVDLIKAFVYRPRSILPKSDFLKQARDISVRSKVQASTAPLT